MRLGVIVGLFAACSFSVAPQTADDGSSMSVSGDGPPSDAAELRGDAPAGTCDQIACGTAGGNCVNGACEIDYAGPSTVTCPSDMPCVVRCVTGNNSCMGGVDCTRASSCAITCRGMNACTGGVACGAGACDVDCSGNNTCEHETCPMTPASCTFNCCGNNACQGALCGECAITHSCM